MHSLTHHMQFPMVSHGRHCAPTTLGILSPILCAWVLVHVALVSFWLVSRLVFPFALMLLCDLPHMYAFCLVSPRLLYPHVFHIRCLFLLFSPWLPSHIYKTQKACMFRQFVYRLWSVVMLQVAQATRILQKSRPEIRKFRGFLELASARALHLPSVASRVFRMEVTNQVSRTCRNGVVYWNDSEYECKGKRSKGSEFV